MKLLRTAILAAAMTVGVMPAAFAQSTDTVDASAYARAGLTPVAHATPRYPVRSEAAREEGSCTVVFDIMPSGAVENAETRACTSWDFEREAKRVVAELRYPERADGAVLRDQEITFRWVGEAESD